jgi:peptidoglycan/xylan/chitin deacetylase (PgdA/CDA1 family)
MRTALILAAIVSANASAATRCDADALGTARTLVLKREYGAWGKAQHEALPLQKGEVVLTFDDGPRPESTPVVLRALADQCVQATFFMIGAKLEQSPDLAHRVAREGHSTAIHSYTHPSLQKLSRAEQLDDLKRAEDSYRAAFGAAPPAYRFPYLEETPDLMEALKSRKIAVFSVDLGIDDWQDDDTTGKLATRLAERLKISGGGIVLMHDAHQATADAMPVLLKVLKTNGFRIVHIEWEK